jgi:hypothetical protein
MNHISKRCSTCQVFKSSSEFNKCKSNRDGLHFVCKSCRQTERQRNRDHIVAKNRAYYLANKAKMCAMSKRYNFANKDKIFVQRRQYRETHKEERARKAKAYLPIRKQRIKQLRLSNANFRLSEVLRSKVHKMLRGLDTSYRTYIGCSNEHLRLWLQYQFDEHMSWDNYGTIWHIDHILAINLFDLSDEHFHWTNLQPLKKFDNQSKSDRFVPHYYWNSVITVHRFEGGHGAEGSGYQALRESLTWLRKYLRSVKIPWM